MWNFKKSFDFNAIMEALEIDDNIEDTQQSNFYKDQQIKGFSMSNFEIIIMSLLNNIDINVNSIDKNSIGYKEYVDNGVTHYICYLQYNTGQRNSQGYFDIYNWFFDYNDETRDLVIGNVNQYPRAKWLNISWPIIKMISEYKGGKVYIGEIHIDTNMRHPISAQEALDKSKQNEYDLGINLPLKFVNILENCSFFRTNWKGNKYYLPDDEHYIKICKNWPNQLIIPHSFVENFQGILSNHGAIIAGGNEAEHTILFREMFESVEDFKKVVYLLCKAGYPVNDKTTSTIYNPENYQDLLSKDDNQIEQLNSIEEQKYKDKLINLLGESTINYYDDIIKSDGMISVGQLFKERASGKDLYRKFNDTIVKKMLLDNNINIDKIISDSHDRVINYYKDIFDEVIKNNISMFDLILGFRDDREYIKFKGNQKLINLIKDLKKEIAKIDDDDVNLLKDYYDKHNGQQFEYNILEAHNKYITYSELTPEQCLLERFYYLLCNKCSEYEINVLQKQRIFAGKQKIIDRLNKILTGAEGLRILSTNYNEGIRINWNISTDPTPFNLSNIEFIINSYESLYKFYYFIVYAIENGYNNLDVLNFNSIDDNDNIQIDDYIKLVINKQFTSDIPDINTFNNSTLLRCLNTIFGNIANRLKKK